MDVIEWYAVSLATILSLWMVICLARSLVALCHRYTLPPFLKHVYYPRLYRYGGRATRYHAILIVALLVCSALLLFLGTHGRADIASRSGLLCIANLIPLLLGSRMNIFVSYCGIGHESYVTIHRWLGLVAILEGTIHIVLTILSHKLLLASSAGKAALVAAAAMGGILVSSSQLIRRYFYEFFVQIHRILALTLVVALWLHVPGKTTATPKLYLLILGCLYLCLLCFRTGQQMYRNMRDWRLGSVCQIESLPDAYQIRVTVARPWNFRAGQYAYLCIPRIGHFASFQSHPYMVAWWYSEGASNVIILLVQRQSGFTQHLPTSDLEDHREWKAILEGPYGKEVHLDQYGTVLLFATGMGIAGQLPYMRQLLADFHAYNAKSREIVLFWEVESENHRKWVGHWMDDLLQQDDKHVSLKESLCESLSSIEKILDIHIFISNNYTTQGAKSGQVGYIGKHRRIQVVYSRLDIEGLIRSRFNEGNGRGVVSSCVNDVVAHKIREVVRNLPNRGVSLVELPFLPT